MFRSLWQKLLLFFQQFGNRFRSLPGIPAPAGTGVPVTLFMLPAHYGDTFIIEFIGDDNKPHYIWVDGGLVKSYQEHGKAVLKEFARLKASIDLMVVTHVDQDHIGGVLAFVNDPELKKDMVKHFWFNSSRLISKYFSTSHKKQREINLTGFGFASRSMEQGEVLEDFLENTQKWHENPLLSQQQFELSGALLTLVSPDERALQRLNEAWEIEVGDQTRSLGAEETDYRVTIESLARREEERDRSVANGSSIGFIFEYAGKKILMLGDAYPSVVAASLREMGYSTRNPLKLDALKLAHHGSKGNISNELLSLIHCQKYLISTDGSRFGLPNKEALARILTQPSRKDHEQMVFIFNHGNEHLRGIFSESEQQKHNFVCRYPPEDKPGCILEI